MNGLRNDTIRVVALAVPCAIFLATAGCRAERPVTDARNTRAAAERDTSRDPSQGHDYRVVTVVDGLVHPWSMAFLPGGDMLVTERPGRLRLVRNGVLQPEPIAGVPAVRARGQGGLLEVMLHPDFAQNRLVYLTYSKPSADDSQATTAVSRGRFDGERLTDVEEIFEAQAWSGAGQHFGSKLAFDGRGHVFITVGDRGASPNLQERHPSQSLENHQGTIIRLHDDGRVPSDNPFVGRARALPGIWSYGHRNPQGLAIHPETGDVWSNEHGPQGGDELNHVRPGVNYGWPVIGHGVNYGGARIHQGTDAAGIERPVHYWVPSIATSGLMIYTGDRFPNWRGSIFTGGLAGQVISRKVMDGTRVVSEERIFENRGRVRDIRQGPDGFIYVAIDDRGGAETAIVRLEPQ
ncbi:PQQ-dependent sugar dehydrogenase [soil metagenome]